MTDFRTAARYTDRENPLPHQDAAWQYAWECLTPEERAEFLSLFRAAPKPKEPLAAVRGDVPNTWEGIAGAAKAAGATFPELVAAQWALESGNGRKLTGENNPFGLKASAGGTEAPTTEFVNGRRVSTRDRFLDFESRKAAVDYLVARWYRDWEGHRGVNRAADRDAAARLLLSEGYATDPAYATKLIDLMDRRGPRAGDATAEGVRARADVWRTRVKALKLSQPDASTCQAACLAMAVGDPDVRRVRARLVATGRPAGDPATMAAVVRQHYPEAAGRYTLDLDGSLEKAIEWLKAGDLLITHGWFTRSGHVIVLDGLRRNPNGSLDYDTADPFSEFDAAAWAYQSSAKFFDGFYSERLIYAACVAGTSASHAAGIYKAGAVDRKRGGMWIHRFRPPSAAMA